MSNKQLDLVLLLALPASGKSEVRNCIEHLDPERREESLHMRESLQLDDFPYVHIMREIDRELSEKGLPFLFFQSLEKPFSNTKDWGTLTELLNEDYADVMHHKCVNPASAARHMFERLDRAGEVVGVAPRLAALDESLLAELADKLELECRKVADTMLKLQQDTENKTVVIEFARGGPDGSSMPLTNGYGYQYSLAKLSPEILEKATILYIWVTPEESRRKNSARANPDDPGSILHHGVPMDVMLGDYGCDDMNWLLDQSDKPDTVQVERDGKTYHIPMAKFDNRVDKTSFLRADPADWAEEDVAKVQAGLKEALDKLV
ncbi:MAG: hypothetical protein KAT71_02750 [Gammaproteobacteria bacterium]|nr:hypothetical protein [Gammaproteobacteria bacterium]